MKSILCLIFSLVWVSVYAIPTNPVIKITPNPTNPSSVTQTLGLGSLHIQRICAGQQVKLEAISTGAGTLSYQWIRIQTGDVVGTGAVVTLSIIEGQYVVKVTDDTGSTTSTTVIQICVETEPPFNAVITSNGTASICTTGNTPDIVLTATAQNQPGSAACNNSTFKYKWYKNNVLISGSTSSSFTLGNQAGNSGTYKVEIYNACGFDDATIKIGLADNPPLEVTVFTDDASNVICPSSSITLRATAIGTVDTYQWFKDGTPIVIGTGSSISVGGSGAYYVKAKNGCGEKQSANFVVVNSAPPANVILGSNPFGGVLCQNQTLLLAPIGLTGGAPSRIEYYKDSQLYYATSSPFPNGITCLASQAGEYKVKVINKCGNITSAALQVSNSNGATAGAIDLAGSSTSLGCGNTTITANIISNGAVDAYFWYQYQDWSGAYEEIIGENNPTLNISAIGSYYGLVYSACGGFITDTLHVVELTDPPLTSITLQSANGLTTCEGKIRLTATDVGAGTAYKWFKNNVLYQTTSKNFTDATESGDYSVQAVNACGSSSVSNVLGLVVKKKAAKPTIIAPFGTYLCSSGTIPLVMSSAVEDGISYQWFKDGAAIGGATQTTLETTTSGVYKLQALNPNNDCPIEVSDAIEVRFITPTNVNNLSIQMNVCETPLVLRALSSGTFLTYRWLLLDGGSFTIVGNANTYTPTASGTYAVSVRNDCMVAGVWLTSQSVRIFVLGGGNSVPIPEIISDPVGIDRICPETSVKLKVQASVLLPNTAYRWFWNDEMIVGETNTEITTAKSGLYRVEVYNTLNPACGQISSPYSIFVRPIPTLLLSYNPSLTFCEGDSVRLTSGAQQIPSNFEWTLNGTPLHTGNLLYAKQGGTYQVKGLYNAGTLSFPCDYETTRTIETTMLPAPIPEITVKGGLLESKNIVESYQWNYENIPILGANKPFFMPVDSGRYSLTVTNDLGCSGTSAMVKHKGIYEDITPILQISPNPNQGNFRVTIVGKEEIVFVELYNAQGQELLPSSPTMRVNSLASHTEIDFKGLARGTYLVRASIGGKQYVKRIVVM